MTEEESYQVSQIVREFPYMSDIQLEAIAFQIYVAQSERYATEAALSAMTSQEAPSRTYARIRGE